MNKRIKELAKDHFCRTEYDSGNVHECYEFSEKELEKFAQLIVEECINREILLGAIARGWCSEKNKHKIMDADLALGIFDEVEKQIKKHFGVEE